MAARQSPQTKPPKPPRTAPLSRTRRRALLLPVAAVVLGALLIHNDLDTPAGLEPQAGPAAVAPATPHATHPSPSQSAARAGLALPRSVPKRISIPEIDVDAPFTALSIGASGRLNAPPKDDNNLVGWFEGAASPGERGSSIVVGHVDTMTGPAVFLELRLLKPGSRVDITRADGIVARFKVDTVDTFSKADFPDDRVYADTPSPQLRLITCGGNFDQETQNYEDNVVVFAHLDSAKRA
ncbi:class F sortase [Streptomyces sp. NPDC052236]|uniref:class F sortase n=1 Tax=Streptomyces sp. NPDC052236 TaxID=3365686 RepID=UPI0037D3AFA6